MSRTLIIGNNSVIIAACLAMHGNVRFTAVTAREVNCFVPLCNGLGNLAEAKIPFEETPTAKIMTKHGRTFKLPPKKRYCTQKRHL